MLCGTDIIMWNILNIQSEFGDMPHNIVNPT